MSQRRRERAFTLVELVIVITIMATLATVALPTIISSGTEGDETALVTDLAAIRSSISLYKSQHNDRLPGLVSGKKPSDPAKAFVDQMLLYSDANGKTSSTKSGSYKYGPYIQSRSGFLPCPAGKKEGNAQVLVNASQTQLTAKADEAQAWKYSYQTGEFICNDPSTDSNGTPFSTY